MHILDRPTPSPILLNQHIRLEMPFFDAVRVELQLRPGDGIDERVYHLVEGVKEEGNVDDERPSETLGVVILEDIQNLYKRVIRCEHSTESLEGKVATLREVEKAGLLALSP